MVGVGGSASRGSQSIIQDAFLSAGNDYQRLTSFGGQTYWADAEIYLTFQPLLSDQVNTVGISKAFAVVPNYTAVRWTCRNITIAFHTRFAGGSSAVISFLEKRIDGSYNLMRTNVTMSSVMTGAYFADMAYDLQEGSTLYLEVISQNNAQPLGFSATAALLQRAGANTPNNVPFAVQGAYPETATASMDGVLPGEYYTFDAASLWGTEGALVYVGTAVNQLIKGFYASTYSAAQALPVGSLYALQDSLQGADGKVMLVGYPAITSQSFVKGYYLDNAAALAGGLVAGQYYALSQSSIIDTQGSVFKVL